MKPRVVVWYSDGAASAVAAQRALKLYGKRRTAVVKCDTTWPCVCVGGARIGKP